MSKLVEKLRDSFVVRSAMATFVAILCTCNLATAGSVFQSFVFGQDFIWR